MLEYYSITALVTLLLIIGVIHYTALVLELLLVLIRHIRDECKSLLCLLAKIVRALKSDDS